MTTGTAIGLLILLAVSAFCWLIVFSNSARQIFQSDRWWWKFSNNDEENKRIRDRMTFTIMLIAALATTALLAYVIFLVVSL
jgi:hypothetical protein